jgi:hypothetical protein
METLQARLTPRKQHGTRRNTILPRLRNERARLITLQPATTTA